MPFTLNKPECYYLSVFTNIIQIDRRTKGKRKAVKFICVHSAEHEAEVGKGVQLLGVLTL